MSEPSSRSLEEARELLHGRVFEEAQIAVALAIAAARAEERERCARIAERSQVTRDMGVIGNAIDATARGIAAAIRVEKIGESEERTTHE